MIDVKSHSANVFWFGDDLVDMNMLWHFDAKPKSRPWGHGHKIGMALGNLRSYAEKLHKRKELNEHAFNQIREAIKILREFNYPV